MITITLEGDFGPRRTKTFFAMQAGHTAAVAQAITYLANEELLDAIERDHRLHQRGGEPEEGFAGRGRLVLGRKEAPDAPAS